MFWRAEDREDFKNHEDLDDVNSLAQVSSHPPRINCRPLVHRIIWQALGYAVEDQHLFIWSIEAKSQWGLGKDPLTTTSVVNAVSIGTQQMSVVALTGGAIIKMHRHIKTVFYDHIISAYFGLRLLGFWGIFFYPSRGRRTRGSALTSSWSWFPKNGLTPGMSPCGCCCHVTSSDDQLPSSVQGAQHLQ